MGYRLGKWQLQRYNDLSDEDEIHAGEVSGLSGTDPEACWVYIKLQKTIPPLAYGIETFSCNGGSVRLMIITLQLFSLQEVSTVETEVDRPSIDRRRLYASLLQSSGTPRPAPYFL